MNIIDHSDRGSISSIESPADSYEPLHALKYNNQLAWPTLVAPLSIMVVQVMFRIDPKLKLLSLV